MHGPYRAVAISFMTTIPTRRISESFLFRVDVVLLLSFYSETDFYVFELEVGPIRQMDPLTYRRPGNPYKN